MPTVLTPEQRSVADIVAGVARGYGLDPRTALSSAYLESKLNRYAVGDNGSSFGTFQLHIGGELPRDWQSQYMQGPSGRIPVNAADPGKNATVALGVFAANAAKYSDPGTLAAKSQRPANPTAYANEVNNIYKSGLFDSYVNGGSVRGSQNYNSLAQTNVASNVQAQQIFWGEDKLKGFMKDYVPGYSEASQVGSVLEYVVANSGQIAIRTIETIAGFQLMFAGGITILAILAYRGVKSAPPELKSAANIALLAFPELSVARAAKAAGAARTAKAATAAKSVV